MPTWLVALDLDGTVLTADYKVLPRVREQIQNARRDGVHVVLATARAIRSVQYVLDDVGGIDAVICFGGALTLASRNAIWSRDDGLGDTTIPSAFLRDIVSKARIKGISLAQYGRCDVYVDRLDNVLDRQFRNTGLSCIQGDLLAVKEPALKLLAIGEHATIQAVEEIKSEFGDVLSCLYSHASYLEITHKSVSKGNALDHYRNSMGIARENVIAIGDSENDLSMFAVAGIPIAMGNANDGVGAGYV